MSEIPISTSALSPEAKAEQRRSRMIVALLTADTILIFAIAIILLIRR